MSSSEDAPSSREDAGKSALPLLNAGPAGESEPPFYVVGIGASAGGLEALEKLFERMPEQTGLAFVIIQHLSPDFQSHMDELLGRKTKIPIHLVEDGVQVEPDAIYLMPPKKEMIISQGRLLLTDKDPARGLSMPIDAFLRSLAQDMGRQSIAIILSGTGSDGSRGVKHVHEAGGLVIVQDEETAKFNGMPLAAIDTGVVDWILPPQAIPDALEKYMHRSLNPDQRAQQEIRAVPDEGMERIFQLLRSEYGIDFTHYKPSTVLRRTERRSSLADVRDVEAYARLVSEHPEELDRLYRDLLIGVTQFFRDEEAWDYLAKEVIAPLVAHADPSEEIRVWVAGCATGEEAYSLAILFHEQFEADHRPLKVKIFATDVHRESLEFASNGVYNEEHIGKMRRDRRQRYFVQKGQQYHVVPELRQMIVFARHNIITDAPFTKLHLVTCRNLLIYLQPMAQKKVLSLFHFGLRTNGYLFLGSSETPGEIRDEFDLVDNHWRIYRKRRDVRLPSSLRMAISPGAAVRYREPPRQIPSVQDRSLLEHYEVLLNRYMPASMLIDEDYQLLHVFGGAERYLRVKGGRSPANVLEMFEEELKTAVAGALQHAKKANAPVTYTGVHSSSDDARQTLKLRIEPVPLGPDKPGAFLITLEPLEQPPAQDEEASDYDSTQMTREQIGTLESELRFTKENLQATIEELETSNEELQATNQELVASNEELQSTNEELQSVNEELYTVNAEHQRKIAELSEMTDDMHNLLESTDVGVIYLDRELRIRRFTPRMAASFNLLPQDVGRRLDTFAHTIDDPDLLVDVRRVLETEEGIEKQVADKSGVPFFLRILPYRTQTRVDGVVLTLIEISSLIEAQTARREAEAQLRESEARKGAILDSALDAIVTIDHTGNIIEFNPAAEAMFGYPAEKILGQPMAEKIIPLGHRDAQARAFREFLESGKTSILNRRVELMALRKDGTEFPVELAVRQITTDGPPVFTGFIRDITDRRNAEKVIRERETQFRGTFENAAVGMAHITMEGQWLRVNHRLCEILGYSPEELTQKTFQDITHPDDLAANLKQFLRLKSGEIQSYQLEERYIRKDGSAVWVALTVSLQFDEDHHPLYYIAIVQDISRRKQFEQELQAAVQARESFLAMLSHELRNPLSAVLNATRLLRRGDFSASGFSPDDVTSVIERQSQQIAKLLADLLDVSRISKGKIELDRQPVNLCELVEAVRETVASTLQEHDITLSVHVPDQPVWVEGDPTRLQQIQVNLLGNAAKYSPPQSHVSLTIQTDDGEALIRVKDAGIGIPPHLLERIFEPFVQSDETLDRSEGGLGMGLALVSSLVKLHGGRASAHSEGRGKGSEFIVRLPLLSITDNEQPPSADESSEPAAEPLRIVLVEDIPDNAHLLKLHLEMDGHQVSLAYDGQEGLERVLQEQPDIAILDIGIPKLDGYQVAQKIRSEANGNNGKAPDLFLVALTGYGQPDDVQKALKSGFDTHLVKPLDFGKLREILASRSSAKKQPQRSE